MKYLKATGLFFLFAMLALAPGRARAQQTTNPSWLLSVSNSPTQVGVGGTITYTIFVSNRVTMPGIVLVTNQFSGPFTFVSSTNSLNVSVIGTNVTGANAFVFQYNGTPFTSTFITNTLTLKVQPTTSGVFTNIVSISEQNVLSNAVLVTNTITVSNSTTSLGVSITLPTLPVLSNDWVTYTILVTNPSATSATSVTLSNYLPTGAIVILPTNPPPTNGVMAISLGTLAAHASTNLAFTIQPTIVGTNIFTASVGRTTQVFATNSLVVNAFDTTQMTATSLGAMGFDPQTGLMEQTVQLSNTNTNSIDSSRVVVMGLATNQVLYNGIGTNNGNPFVQYSGSLAPGSNVNLVLEYFIPTRRDISSNLSFAAVPVSATNFVSPGGTLIGATNVTLSAGRVLVQFPAITGRTYTILYADNPLMTNALAAVPPVVAPGDRIQWIDDGPPKTISAPSSVPQRFYQAVLDQ